MIVVADFRVSSNGDVVPEQRLGPTPEREARARATAGDAVDRIVTDGMVSAVRLMDGDVLELLLKRGVITSELYAAGQAFHLNYRRAGLEALGAVDPSRDVVDGGQHKPVSEQALASLGRWRAMVRGVGQVHSEILCDCILRCESLAAWGLRKRGNSSARLAGEWAQGRFVAALEQLALYIAGPRHNPIRSCVPEDAKPWLTPSSSTHGEGG